MTVLASSIDSDPYLTLVAEFPLRPIRSKASLERATQRLLQLFARKDRAATDYRQVLVGLIADYEKRMGWHIDTSHFSAADIVRHLLGERDMSVNALAKEVGISQSSLCEMLSGRRGWSKNAIARLSDYFALNPRLFLK